jgi:molybdate transport system permease protein
VDWIALGLSVRLATATMLLLVVVGVPIAYWIAFSTWRWKFLVEAVVALPIVLPPTVLGFYMLVALGPASPIGRTYSTIVGRGLPFSFEGLLIASMVYSLPFAVQPFSAGFATVDRRLIEASWCLGASRTATFVRIVLPLSLPGLVTGMVLSFAHTLGEFGVVLMIGGNIPGQTEVLSTRIYQLVESMQFGDAHRIAAGMVAFAFLALFALLLVERRMTRMMP